MTTLVFSAYDNAGKYCIITMPTANIPECRLKLQRQGFNSIKLLASCERVITIK